MLSPSFIFTLMSITLLSLPLVLLDETHLELSTHSETLRGVGIMSSDWCGLSSMLFPFGALNALDTLCANMPYLHGIQAKCFKKWFQRPPGTIRLYSL